MDNIQSEKFNIQVNVPLSWSTYTKSANKALSSKAKVLVKRINMVNRKDPMRNVFLTKAFSLFFISWRKMSKSPTYKKAGITDTEVRNSLREFAENCGEKVSIPKEMITAIYETSYWV